MYESYFGLSESPFNVTPDPGVFFINPCYQEAFATLQYGILARKGFVVVTGEPGTGKTTLLRRLICSLDANVQIAYVFNTQLGFTDILRLTLTDLGIPNSSRDRLTLVSDFNDYLIKQARRGVIVSLLVDEAQNLAGEALEGLRLLSNLETDKIKLIQIILMGQPELDRKLNQPELVQLRQRVVHRCRLRPLKLDEVGSYIEMRLKAVSGGRKDLFPTDTIERIAAYSKGIPRLINIICDNALLIAYATSRTVIGAEVIEEVADELQLRDPAPSPARAVSTKRPELNAACDVAESAGMSGRGEEPAKDCWRITSESGAQSGPGRIPAIDHHRLRGSSVAWVTTLALVLTGAILFLSPEQRPIYLSRVADGLGKIKRVFAPPSRESPRLLITHALGENVDDEGNVVENQRPENSASLKSDSLSNLEPSTEAGHGDAKAVASDQDDHRAQSKQTPKRSERAGNSPTVPRPRPGRQNIENRKSYSSEKRFQVVANSFVRNKPTSDAEIIETLGAGTRIQLIGRVGDYLQIRSLEPNKVRGYVHKEDAFFEPLR